MASAEPAANWEEVADQMAAGLALGGPMQQPATPDIPNADQDEAGASGSSAPRLASVEEAAAAPGQLAPEALSAVDHALRDALSHPKNRAAVLKLEEEVEAFVLGTQDPQHIFGRDMTSYERLLAHRTAQHWGLETTTISQGPDQGKIVAYRSPQTAVPQVKLSSVPVTMAELPSTSDASNPVSPAPAPRVLVRKRPDRLGPRGGDGMMHGGVPFPDAAGFRSHEERQQEYHRARARIFGGEVGYMQVPPQPYPMQPQQRGPVYGAAGLPSSPGQSPFPVSPQRAGGMGGFARPPMAGWQAAGGGMGPVPGGGGGGNGGSGNGAGRKAVLRNKHEDLNDPDFRRHRHAGPRFDPGFGEDEASQQSMYIRPTYSSEFPELSGGQPSPSSRSGGSGVRPGGGGGMGGPGGPRQSPRRANGGMAMQPGAGGAMGGGAPMGPPAGMYSMGPYGGQGMPPGMMAASPMGPFMVPPGMMVAGPMPGMGGGMAVYSPGGGPMPYPHPGMGAAGYYPMPAYGYYPAAAMQPGGGGGQEGVPGAAAAMQYAVPAYGYHPGIPPGAAAAMGGFPGGPAAAAAMAAMSGAAPGMPGPMPLSPSAAAAQSPRLASMGRQRSSDRRSRNNSMSSSGGPAGGGGYGGSPASTPQQQQPEPPPQAELPAAPTAEVPEPAQQDEVPAQQ